MATVTALSRKTAASPVLTADDAKNADIRMIQTSPDNCRGTFLFYEFPVTASLARGELTDDLDEQIGALVHLLSHCMFVRTVMSVTSR